MSEKKARSTATNKALHVTALLLLLIIFISAIFCAYKAYSIYTTERANEEAEALAASREAMRTEARGGVPRAGGGIKLHSRYVLLYDVDNERVLMAHNADIQCSPASLTKMMTVYTALSCIENLDEIVQITYADLAGLYEENASVAGYVAGDAATLRDLLYAVMLPSGADAANALARNICGSVSDFVEKMNALSVTLGMESTHWENVTGLDAQGHETTCRDLLILMKAAMQDNDFCTIFDTFEYKTAPTAAYPQGIELESTIAKKSREMGIDFAPIVGGKTGFTDNAGLCLASVADIDGHIYYCITMGADGTSHGEQYNITDQLELYGHCK